MCSKNCRVFLCVDSCSTQDSYEGLMTDIIDLMSVRGLAVNGLQLRCGLEMSEVVFCDFMCSFSR